MPGLVQFEEFLFFLVSGGSVDVHDISVYIEDPEYLANRRLEESGCSLPSQVGVALDRAWIEGADRRYAQFRGSHEVEHGRRQPAPSIGPVQQVDSGAAVVAAISGVRGRWWLAGRREARSAQS